MKKITLLFILCLTATTWLYGQCTTIPGGNYPGGLITVFNDGTAEEISTDNWGAGEYSAISGLINGNTYTVTGTNTLGIYITVAEIDWNAPALNGTVLGHGPSSVSFTATTSDIIIHWHLNAACDTTGTEDTVTSIQCTSATCACTETAAPACPTLIAPADAATDVATTLSTDGLSRRVELSWNAVPGAVSYDIEFDGTVIGSTPNLTVGITGLDYDTTYSWSMLPVNCFDTATGCVTYTFTTEEDPALSVDEFENVTFSIYPNPANNLVNIKTDLSIDNIDVVNMLGQTVKTYTNITNKSIDISTLNNGVYFLNITAEGKTQSIRIIKE